jgi:hypothetical protein
METEEEYEEDDEEEVEGTEDDPLPAVNRCWKSEF